MKKILSMVLFVFLLFGGFNYVNASNESKVTKIMSTFYSKLDKSISDTEKKINKIEVLNNKIKSIKKNKWNKLSETSKNLLNLIESNINNKIIFYKKELENRKKIVEKEKEKINIEKLLPKIRKCENGIEKITFAVDSEYAKNYPNWKQGARDLINEVNKIFAKNTNKKYEIVQYKIFDIKNWKNLSNKSEYFYENSGFDNDFGGTTYFYWGDTSDGTSPYMKDENGANVLTNVTDFTTINNKKYNILYQVGTVQDYYKGLLSGKNFLNTHNEALYFPVHELGHTLGLGKIEWYFFTYKDHTNIEPILNSYDIKTIYPTDPMIDQSVKEFKFSYLNSNIINDNICHDKNINNIVNIKTVKTKIIVKDIKGNIVSNAKIDVYGARKGCFYCKESDYNTSPFLETTYTDNNGIAYIKSPSNSWDWNQNSNSKYIAKIIKVKKGDLSGAGYVNSLELQKIKYLNKSDTFTKTIIIDTIDNLYKTNKYININEEEVSISCELKEKNHITCTAKARNNTVIGFNFLVNGSGYQMGEKNTLDFFINEDVEIYVVAKDNSMTGGYGGQSSVVNFKYIK